MTHNIKPLLFSLFLSFLATLPALSRETLNFDRGWLFCLGDSSAMARTDYADTSWRQLDLPHDWAIEGDFSVDNPSGAGGGALPGGIGWYRKHFTVPASLTADDHLFITFDGVYMNSSVYINGHLLGTRPYGYISFQYDLTPYLRRGADNVIAVRVDNSDQPNSRWYSGCGIYRNVWLTATSPLHIANWGVYVMPTTKNGRTWTVPVTVTLADDSQKGQHPMVRNTLFDSNGKIVAQVANGSTEQEMTVRNPRLWSPDAPNVYSLLTEIVIAGKTVDAVRTTTAFRSFRFDAKTGFWLNGKNMKLNGVCDHHDLGCLGAALDNDALRRQLVKLKDMGVNAIRCSHNPPAPELLNMADTMGFIVMDEAFDMWMRRKTKNDYARFFEKWHQRDLTDMLLRDRNHPSILIWSIGNEVLEQWSSASADALSLEQANLILNAGHDASTLAHGKEL